MAVDCNKKEKHHDVMLENYILKLDIESRTLEELCLNYVLPSAVDYQTTLASNITTMKSAGIAAKNCVYQSTTLKRMVSDMNGIHDCLKKMETERNKAQRGKSSRSVAIAYCRKVKPLMDKIREYADDLELIVDDKEWALVKYRELMFMK